MSYEYLPIEQAKDGDIVEFNNEGYKGSYRHNSVYVVKKFEYNIIQTLLDDKGSTSNGMQKGNFKLIKTKPGSEAKVGDEVICVSTLGYSSTSSRIPIKGKVYTIQSSNGLQISPDKDRMWVKGDFKVLCKPTEKTQTYLSKSELTSWNALEHFKDFTVGQTLNRIGASVNGLTKGRTYTLLGISQSKTSTHNVQLTIKDNNGNIRKWCSASAFKPIEQTQSIFKDSTQALKDFLLLTSDEDLSFAHSLDLVKDWELCEQTYPLILHSYNCGYNPNLYNWDSVYREALTVQEFANKYNLQIPKIKELPMKRLDLALLVQFLTDVQKDQEPKVNATNANHVAIMTEDNGEYVGYVYANTLEELEDIVRLPANEGRQLHVFDYSTTFTQKPRKVVKIERVQDEQK